MTRAIDLLGGPTQDSDEEQQGPVRDEYLLSDKFDPGVWLVKAVSRQLKTDDWNQSQLTSSNTRKLRRGRPPRRATPTAIG